MRFLIFSDLHLHNWNYGSTVVDGMNSRLLDQASVLSQIAEEAQYVDHIVFGGDLFHTHGKLDSAVLKVAYEGIQDILTKSNADMTLLVGNHDTDRKNKSIHSLHWLNAFGAQVRVVDDVWHDLGLDASFLAFTDSKFLLEKFLRMSRSTAFMHQGVSGIPMGSGFLVDEILTPDMVPDHVNRVFTGHYHTRVQVDKITVIASTMQLNWSDEGQKKGFLIYDSESDEIEQIDVKAPEFITYNMTNALREGRQTQPSIEGNFIRVTNAEKAYYEDIRKEFTEAGARSVEFVPAVVEAGPLQPLPGDGFHLPSLVADYEKTKEVDDERHKIGQELMQ